jgi:hypothetical protein
MDLSKIPVTKKKYSSTPKKTTTTAKKRGMNLENIPVRGKSKTATKPAAKTSKFGVGSSKTIQHRGRSMANVTKEQLQKSGYKSLTAYMNAWNKQGKRPTKKK